MSFKIGIAGMGQRWINVNKAFADYALVRTT